MKLANLFLSSLFSAGIIAAPESKKVEIDPHHGYVHHHGLKCTIQNTSEVNCRSGPGIEYEVVTSLKKDFEGTFTCVERGECVTIDGFRNCGWDRIYHLGVPCYVSGHYTSEECSLANLGWCDGSETSG
ncbi:hypothetical protein C7999DRAFT_16222 [Corynascus novoguineensis]|uniref:Uncharacterized protein n=1 Tax=Corynascus novoguineensis TaxID=1126955 RepID=A0AAN7CNU8_9PEZI|nr:hypothetical protein C7999DRAFT_16222 [Corynascus novoguineensis]